MNVKDYKAKEKITTKEVAAQWGVNMSTVNDWIRKGIDMPPKKTKVAGTAKKVIAKKKARPTKKAEQETKVKLIKQAAKTASEINRMAVLLGVYREYILLRDEKNAKRIETILLENLETCKCIIDKK